VREERGTVWGEFDTASGSFELRKAELLLEGAFGVPNRM
jgi:hypothetical protein